MNVIFFVFTIVKRQTSGSVLGFSVLRFIFQIHEKGDHLKKKKNSTIAYVQVVFGNLVQADVILLTLGNIGV